MTTQVAFAGAQYTYASSTTQKNEKTILKDYCGTVTGVRRLAKLPASAIKVWRLTTPDVPMGFLEAEKALGNAWRWASIPGIPGAMCRWWETISSDATVEEALQETASTVARIFYGVSTVLVTCFPAFGKEAKTVLEIADFCDGLDEAGTAAKEFYDWRLSCNVTDCTNLAEKDQKAVEVEGSIHLLKMIKAVLSVVGLIAMVALWFEVALLSPLALAIISLAGATAALAADLWETSLEYKMGRFERVDPVVV